MNERIVRLRQRSFSTSPALSIERALLETEFYKEHYGKHSMPVLRALFFKYLCEKKTIHIGAERRRPATGAAGGANLPRVDLPLGR